MKPILLLSCAGLLLPLLMASSALAASPTTFQVEGVTVTPHLPTEGMKFRREPAPPEGALVRIFVRAVAPLQLDRFRFNGQSPPDLLKNREWTWCNLLDPSVTVPSKSLTVLTFNGNTKKWEPGQTVELSYEANDSNPLPPVSVPLHAPELHLSSVAFLGESASVQPDTLLVHVDNHTERRWHIRSLHLHLPEDLKQWQAFEPGKVHTRLDTPKGGIPAGDQGYARLRMGPMPLTYGVIEVGLEDEAGDKQSLWAHLRIRKEAFDISGGWIGGETKGGGNALMNEAYLKALKGIYVNTGQIGLTPGYTDQTGPNGLYTRYPIKLFHQLEPLGEHDTDANLPRIHAAEYLGEPQYNSGKPMPPQEVYDRLLKYAPTRIASSVTLSDASFWHEYAGLSDYPHYDAYRVTAPSADSFRMYDRWNGKRIGWGAPLETIGAMTRSLREMSRPASIAYWSQGPHAGWGVYDGRARTSPTPDELRLQAYHALANRVTSLYWFNLSLRSLAKYPDTLDELRRVGREIRLLEEFYLEGAAYRYRQINRMWQPDWELASIASPEGALLFALDLDYEADEREKVFRFGPPREARWEFELPAYLRKPADLFQVDADGVNSVEYRTTETGVEITDRQNKVAVYVAAPSKETRARLERKRRFLMEEESALGFDPAHPQDIAALKALLPEKGE